MIIQKHFSTRFIIFVLLTVLILPLSFFIKANRTLAAEGGTEVPLHVYFNFYDSSSDDIDHTIGLYSMEISGTVIGAYIEAQINPQPSIFNYQEVNGFPQVLINYGDVSGREMEITEECQYDSLTGFIQVPVKYIDCYLTVKCIMSEQSSAYELLIPDEYKIIKSPNGHLLRKPASDASEFEVIQGSCNDITAGSDISQYNAGDQITIQSGYIQTLNMREDESLYDKTGTSTYKRYKGENIGYAISFDCGNHTALSNIGSSGTTGSGSFPSQSGSYESIDYSSRNWMYARCITTDNNYFSGNPKFTGGKVYITNKASDGTLTCWVELYLSGPNGQNAQNVGMYFKIHPTEKTTSVNLTINKTIHQDDLWWSHGEPSFIFTISGSDLDGTMHTWRRSITFTKESSSINRKEDGTITLSTTLENIPSGSYQITEQPVSRFVLTNVSAQTDNIEIDIIEKNKSYNGITPISATVCAHLTEHNGEVTFFNRKITWDKLSHKDIRINNFSISSS